MRGRRIGANRCGRLALVAALGLAGCAPAPRDLVLVSLDTVRGDSFDARLEGAPALAAWVRSGVRFRQAFAPTPFTLPSHMTVMTGLPPRVHGIDHLGASLSPAAPTLAERLRERGYRTVAIVNSPWLAPGFGFGRGFESYETVPSGARMAPEIVRRARAELAGAAEGRPLFLFLHFYDAHSQSSEGGALPYLGAEGARSEERAAAGRRFCTAGGACATDFLVAANRGRAEVPEATEAAIRSLYERAVARLEVDVGELLKALAATPRGRRALVVLFADHGEEFREHGRFLHSQPYVESLRVPLVAGSVAGSEGRSVDAPVELADLYGTLASVPAAIDRLAAATEGQPGRLLLSQDKLFRRVWAARDARWTLLWDRRDGRLALYDRATDPGERSDIAAAAPERTAAMRRGLARELERQRREASRYAPGVRSEPLDREQERQLRALGYLGGDGSR